MKSNVVRTECASIPGNHGGSSKRGGMEHVCPLPRCAGPEGDGDIPLGIPASCEISRVQRFARANPGTHSMAETEK